jgi:hypothetical protein
MRGWRHARVTVKYEVQLGVDAPATLPIRQRSSANGLNKGNETGTTQKNHARDWSDRVLAKGAIRRKLNLVGETKPFRNNPFQE